MKRDIRINYIKIEDLSNKLENYKIALEDVEDSMEDLKAFLQEQESEAVEGLLDKISDVNVDTTKKCSMIEEIMTTINGFVSEMRSYIEPVSDDTNVRVDRDDIKFNLDQIKTRKNLLNLSVKWSVRGAYHPCIGSDADAINKKNRYERNYNKVENIRTTKLVPLINTIESEIDGMFSIYDNNIVPFENCDDAWKRIINDVYKDYTSFKERVAYTWSKIDDVVYTVIIVASAVCLLVVSVCVLPYTVINGVVIATSVGYAALYKMPDEYIPDFLKNIKNNFIEFGDYLENGIQKAIPTIPHILGSRGYIILMDLLSTPVIPFPGVGLSFGIPSYSPIDVYMHYENNINIWGDGSDFKRKKETGKDYIEYQDKMKQIMYGKYSLLASLLELEENDGAIAGSENICEVIAVYNALVSLNGGNAPAPEYDFPELLKRFEIQGLAAGGTFGTRPTEIKAFLEQSGYEAKMLSGNELTRDSINNLCVDGYETFIITAYNDKDDITKQVHTMCITLENNKYVIHNDGREHDGENDLYEAISNYKNGQSQLIDIIGGKEII